MGNAFPTVQSKAVQERINSHGARPVHLIIRALATDAVGELDVRGENGRTRMDGCRGNPGEAVFLSESGIENYYTDTCKIELCGSRIVWYDTSKIELCGDVRR